MPKALRFVFGKTEASLGAAIVITAIVLSLSSPYFLTVPNLVDLVEAYSVTTILAAGVFVVLVSGGIDISFTATASAGKVIQTGSPSPRSIEIAVVGPVMPYAVRLSPARTSVTRAMSCG